jgi:starch synthase
MLDFLKKLFAAKPAQPAVVEAPYKIEAPESTVQVDGDVVTNKPVTSVADAEAAWPFPNTQASTARKPRAPRKPQPTVEKVAEPQTKPAAKKPAAKKTTPAKPAAPRKPRAPKAAS